MPSDESKEERLDRELIELLNELRVALPGVQVLFAFLLGVPFTQRFGEADRPPEGRLLPDVPLHCGRDGPPDRSVRVPPARLARGDKEHLLVVSNRLAIAGTAFLALAISGAVFVVTDLLFDATSAALVAAVTAAFFGWFWYGLPLFRARATSLATSPAPGRPGMWSRFSTSRTPWTFFARFSRSLIIAGCSTSPRRTTLPFSALTLICPFGMSASRKISVSTLRARVTSSG